MPRGVRPVQPVVTCEEPFHAGARFAVPDHHESGGGHRQILLERAPLAREIRAPARRPDV
jgi:hypothetical protein